MIEERKRAIEGTGSIKNAKKSKTAKKVEGGNAGVAADGGALGAADVAQPLKPIAAGVLKRIEALIPKFEERSHQLTSVISETDAPDMQSAIPDVLRNKAKACESALASHQKKLSEFMENKAAVKTDLATNLSEGKVQFEAAATIMQQMSSLLDMLKEATGGA